MFCEDKVPDNEKANEDAGLLELKQLVEDKIAEDENFETDIMERMKIEFKKCEIQSLNPDASLDARAALKKRLDDLETTVTEDIFKITKEEHKRIQAQKAKECAKLLQDLFGNVNWRRFLENWDDEFTYDLVSKSSSTSAEPSSSSSAYSTSSGDIKAKDESDSLYAQFVNKRMPKPMKPEAGKRNAEKAREERIREIAQNITQPYLERKNITQIQFNRIVEHTTSFFFKMNGELKHELSVENRKQ